MRLLGFKSLAISAALGFAILFAAASDVNAQSRRDIERERQKIERQQQKIASQNAKHERQERIRRQRSRDYSNDGQYNEGLTRRSVNATLYQGYQQGLIAGQSDRRAGKYGRFNVYRNTGSAPNNGDPSSTDYLYRQGYLQGYEDGFHGRSRY